MSHSASLVQLLMGILLTGTGVHASVCPIELEPQSVVVKYGDPLSIICRTQETLQEGIGWGSTEAGSNVTQMNIFTWRVESLTNWNFSAKCYFTPTQPAPLNRCMKEPKVTIYKRPDSVSIRAVNTMDSADEGEEIQLQCDITNVAPAQNLVVLWYQKSSGSYVNEKLKVTNCLNDSACSIGDTRSQQNVSSTISVKLSRAHNNTEFSCAAHLDFGSEGPRLPDQMSKPLNITVNYKPVINITNLPRKMTVNRGDSWELICDADGHPPPKIQWLLSSNQELHAPGNKLIVSEAGTYNCSATNEVGSASHVVEVILKDNSTLYPDQLVAGDKPVIKSTNLLSSNQELHAPGNNLTVSEAGTYNLSASNEVGSASHVVDVIQKDNSTLYPDQLVAGEDYLPLIAGCVAATIVAASLIFFFIYTVYHKIKRMYCYNLKQSLFSTDKGNVAHDNWEMQFPLTRLIKMKRLS